MQMNWFIRWNINISLFKPNERMKGGINRGLVLIDKMTQLFT